MGFRFPISRLNLKQRGGGGGGGRGRSTDVKDARKIMSLVSEAPTANTARARRRATPATRPHGHLSAGHRPVVVVVVQLVRLSDCRR